MIKISNAGLDRRQEISNSCFNVAEDYNVNFDLQFLKLCQYLILLFGGHVGFVRGLSIVLLYFSLPSQDDKRAKDMGVPILSHSAIQLTSRRLPRYSFGDFHLFSIAFAIRGQCLSCPFPFTNPSRTAGTVWAVIAAGNSSP
jgi:hypothetical protein